MITEDAKEDAAMKGISFFLGVLLVTISYSYDAGAQAVFTEDEAQFFADNPGLSTQNFSSGKVTPGNIVTCEVPVDSFSSDDCFDPGDIMPGIQFQNGPVPGDFGIVLAGPNSLNNTNPVNVLIPDTYADNFEIVFPFGVNAAGMHLGCMFDNTGPCGDVYEVRVLGIGGVTLIATDVLTSDQFDKFIGVTSTEPITKIALINITEPSLKGLRDVSFLVPTPLITNIPTLSEWGMIAAAVGFVLVGAFYVVRRRRATA